MTEISKEYAKNANRRRFFTAINIAKVVHVNKEETHISEHN
jgi:hypothetical protein